MSPAPSSSSTGVKRAWGLTKKAKPNKLVKESLMHQARKALSKTVKLVKALLVVKLMRKISSAEATGAAPVKGKSVEEYVADVHKKVEWLKASKQADVAEILLEGVSIHDATASHTGEANAVMQYGITAFRQHPKVVSTIKEIEKTIVKRMEKNGSIRATEQRKEAKKKNSKAKPQEAKKKDTDKADENSPYGPTKTKTAEQPERKIVKPKLRYIDVQERRNGVFLESLAESDEAEREKDEERKQIKKLKLKEYKESGAKKRNKEIRKQRTEEGSSSSNSNGNIYSNRISNSSSSSSSSSSSGGSRIAPKSISEGAKPSVKQLDKLTASGKDWQKTGVHPSWAAKHLAKSAGASTALVENKGSKITFDD